MKMSYKVKKDDGIEKQWPVVAENHTQQPPTKMPVSTAETLKRRRKVLPKGKDYQVTLRPHIETINDDAYFVMAKVMEQLATRMRDGEKLNQNDVNMYYKFADMLVKMQREERMGLQDKADEFDKMTPEELEDMIRKAGSGDNEG